MVDRCTGTIETDDFSTATAAICIRKHAMFKTPSAAEDLAGREPMASLCAGASDHDFHFRGLTPIAGQGDTGWQPI